METSGPYIARMDDTIGPAHRPQGEDVPLKKKKVVNFHISLASARKGACTAVVQWKDYRKLSPPSVQYA